MGHKHASRTAGTKRSRKLKKLIKCKPYRYKAWSSTNTGTTTSSPTDTMYPTNAPFTWPPYTWSPTATMYHSDSSTGTNSPTSTMYPSASATTYPTYSPTITDFPTIPYYKLCVKKNKKYKYKKSRLTRKKKIPEDITYYKKTKKNKSTKEVEKKKRGKKLKIGKDVKKKMNDENETEKKKKGKKLIGKDVKK